MADAAPSVTTTSQPFRDSARRLPRSTQSRGLAWEVSLSTADGLPGLCVLKPEWIRTVERPDLGPLITTLRESRWQEVRTAVLDVLGFEP